MNILSSNSKLYPDGIRSFDLEPRKTCVKCSLCCWATKGRYRANARTHKIRWDINYALSKDHHFPEIFSSYLQRYDVPGPVRFNGTGDMYSQNYLSKCIQIAVMNPHIQFYCYTKSHHLSWHKALKTPNFRVIQSLGGEHDDLVDKRRPHALVFDSTVKMHAKGYHDASYSDLVALDPHIIKIGLKRR
jgi:hypothetical protein